MHGGHAGPQPYPGGKKFLAAFKAKYGNANPDPYAIYGYEAMKLGLDTIKPARRQGQRQGGGAARPVRHEGPQLGAGDVLFDKNGDTTLTDYGLYKVGPDGEPGVRQGRQAPTKTVSAK